MFSTVFIDISLIFVQLGLENLGRVGGGYHQKRIFVYKGSRWSQHSVCTLLKKWIVNTLAKVIKGGYRLSGSIKGGRVEFRVKFFGEYLTNVGFFCSTSA